MSTGNPEIQLSCDTSRLYSYIRIPDNSPVSGNICREFKFQLGLRPPNVTHRLHLAYIHVIFHDVVYHSWLLFNFTLGVVNMRDYVLCLNNIIGFQLSYDFTEVHVLNQNELNTFDELTRQITATL